MRKTVSARGAVVALAASAALASSAALAAEFDGKTNLVCAATEAVACTDSVGCRQGPARVFEMPEFMYVNFKSKVVHARTADATNKVQSPILNMHSSERSLVLQGFENDQGWTISVHRKEGRMTLTVAGGPVTFTIFGVCTPI